MNETRKINILLTASTFPRYEKDTEPRFILDLAEALTKFCNVSVLAPSAPGAKDKEQIGNVNIIRYHYFPLHRFETLCYPGAIVPRIKQKKARALLVPFLFLSLWSTTMRYGKKYDLVNAHWIIPQGIVQSFCKTPYLVTGHGADVTSLNHSFVRLLKKRCLKKAAHITVVSSKLAKSLEKNYDCRDITVCPMGCNLDTFSPVNRIEGYFNDNLKNSTSSTNRSSTPSVVFVGRLAEKKGIIYLLDAMKQTNAHLYIVGDGPLYHSLSTYAEENELPVTFIGNKTHMEIKTIVASADVYVAPSITAKDGDTEGLPVSIMEAMASGTPVIASDSGGISSLITHERNGLLTPEKDSTALANAINRILQNPHFSSQLASQALIDISKYSYENIAKNYFSMYQDVLKSERHHS